MTVTKPISAMASPPPPASHNVPRLNYKGLIRKPVTSNCMRARMAMMQMQMRKCEHRKLIINQHRIRRTQSILDLTWEPVMPMGIRAKMAPEWMHMSIRKHRKQMMEHRRMWRRESIVLENVKIGSYISNQ